MGRGIVEPVDDLRATNPPSNGPLLEALADDFREHGCDLKHLIRTIMTSRVYGLSSVPDERNVADTRNYSRHYRQRLRAEVLLDAVCDITGVPETFAGDAARARGPTGSGPCGPSRSSSTPSAAPTRTRIPPASGRPDTSVVQALHLMNAPGLHAKITSDSGLAARLAASDKHPRQVVEELYLLTYQPLPDRRGSAAGGRAARRSQGRTRPPGRDRRPALGAASTRRSSSSRTDPKPPDSRAISMAVHTELRIDDPPRLPAARPGRPCSAAASSTPCGCAAGPRRRPRAARRRAAS